MRYTVQAVARLTGLKARRIRGWEERYDLIHPARKNGGWRLYSLRDIARVRWVKAMLDRGASLKGLALLTEEATFTVQVLCVRVTDGAHGWNARFKTVPHAPQACEVSLTRLPWKPTVGAAYAVELAVQGESP